jgi:hypothetical protein
MSRARRKRHDHFAKDLLLDALAGLGVGTRERALRSEERSLDVTFDARDHDHSTRRALGALGRMVTGYVGIEVHRNAITADELVTCVAKGVDLRSELLRDARRNRTARRSVPRVKVWVFTPTLSGHLRRAFRLAPMPDWPPGILSAGSGFGLGVVVLHDLPETPDTLWLRLLDRGPRQRRAFDELYALPDDHPLRERAIARVIDFVAEATETRNPTPEQKEIVMSSQHLVEKWRREMRAQGEADGEERGRAEGEARAKADAIVAVLEARGIVLSMEMRDRVLGCTDVKTLELWIRRAATVASAEGLFARE